MVRDHRWRSLAILSAIDGKVSDMAKAEIEFPALRRLADGALSPQPPPGIRVSNNQEHGGSLSRYPDIENGKEGDLAWTANT